jgi:hypothetical protein
MAAGTGCLESTERFPVYYLINSQGFNTDGVPSKHLRGFIADVAGSTRLYEQLGDAKSAVHDRPVPGARPRGSSGMAGVSSRPSAMKRCRIPPTSDPGGERRGRDPVAHEQSRSRAHPCESPFASASIAARRIEADDGDVFGDSVNVRRRMVALAKSGQVIF